MLCIVAALIFNSCSNGDELVNGSIVGIVSDYNTGHAIGYATVELWVLNENKSKVEIFKTMLTGSDGYFSFNDLAPGKYYVYGESANYKRNRADVYVNAGEQCQAYLQLVGGEGSLTDLYVNPEIVVFNSNDLNKSVSLYNKGYGDIDYYIVNNCQWITIGKTQGTVRANDYVGIGIGIQRGNLSEGENKTEVVIQTECGNLSFTVVATK